MCCVLASRPAPLRAYNVEMSEIQWIDVEAPLGWDRYPDSKLPMIDPDTIEGEFTPLLSEDMVQLTAPGGRYVIDVGWLPPWRPSGSYVCVIVKDDNWDEPLTRIHTRSYEDVFRWISAAIERINFWVSLGHE